MHRLWLIMLVEQRQEASRITPRSGNLQLAVGDPSKRTPRIIGSPRPSTKARCNVGVGSQPGKRFALSRECNYFVVRIPGLHRCCSLNLGSRERSGRSTVLIVWAELLDKDGIAPPCRSNLSLSSP